MKVLVVVDMQKDFVDGALGTKEAQDIVPKVVEKIRNFDGEVYYTRDTHEKNYLDTQEGKLLPVPHCILGTEGWELVPEIRELAGDGGRAVCPDRGHPSGAGEQPCHQGGYR